MIQGYYAFVLYVNCRNLDVVFVTLNVPAADISGHVDVLSRVYTIVSEKLNAQSVARDMFQCNALTLKELESIQSKHSEPVKAAEQLLNIVMNQSSNVYECFMNSLKLTGQKHVCEIIVIGSDEGKTLCITAFLLLHHKQRFYMLDDVAVILRTNYEV